MRSTRPTADVLRLAALLRAEGFTVAETAAVRVPGLRAAARPPAAARRRLRNRRPRWMIASAGAGGTAGGRGCSAPPS